MEETKHGYWKSAAGELKSLKRLVFAALMCALSIVVGALYVTVGDNLRVYFTFFITAVGCAVYGPVVGMLVAAVTDTLNFLLFPSGPYFPGYMLSEMLA
ncbi:MAG: folate family ECF transporter S component, partial [Candidatus Limivicinus sp.]